MKKLIILIAILALSSSAYPTDVSGPVSGTWILA